MSKQGISKLGNNLRFADILDDVKPLHSDRLNQAESHAPKPRPMPKKTLNDQPHNPKESLQISFDTEDLQPGDSLSFCGPGVQKSIFRKLQRKQYSIGAELDLHGMTVAEAQSSLSQFIHGSRRKNIRCVRIIHGKGHGSGNQGPRLKPMVNQWLQQRKSGIRAFCSARPEDGGTGAVYVLLKSLSPMKIPGSSLR